MIRVTFCGVLGCLQAKCDLGSMLMMCSSVIPSCLLFGVRSPALEPGDSCVEPGLDVSMDTSGRTHAD